MQGIVEWAEQIFIVSIISKLVMHIMPSDKYIEYAKMVCHLIITIICIMPLINFLGKNISFSDIYSSMERKQDINYLADEALICKNDDAVIEKCRVEIIRQIESMAIDNELYPSDTKVVIDSDKDSKTFGKLMKIDITVSLKNKNETDINISKITVGKCKNTQNDIKCCELKQQIADYFNLNNDNVNVYLNGD